MNKRFGNNGLPFDNAPVTFEIVQDVLDKPFHWRKPRAVAVQLMGDIAHEHIPIALLEPIFQVMQSTPRHLYLLLTKRINRFSFALDALCQTFNRGRPLSNLWAGVSICTSDELWKLNELMQMPAAVRFVSLEPLLGPIMSPSGYRTLSRWYSPDGFDRTGSQPEQEQPKPDWIIAGGETSPKARPTKPEWVRSIRDQCEISDTPFFFKSWGTYLPMSQMILGVHLSPGEKPGSDDRFVKAKGDLIDGVKWHQFPKGLSK